MAYIGNSIETQSFTGGMDQFNGNGSNTVFGLTRTINTAYDVDVYVENVWQRPTVGYNVSANTITFTSAPSSGSNNISVVYRSFISQSLVPSDGTVTTNKLGTITNINAGTNTGLTLQANNTTIITANAAGTLAVTGNTTITGTLTASGNVNLDSGTLFVDGTNNRVGIACTTPTRTLTIDATGAAFPSASNPTVRLNETSSGRFAVMELDSSTNLNIWNGDAGSGAIRFYRGSGSGTLSAVIAANGNFGIGTATPGYQLHLKSAFPYVAFEDTEGPTNTVSTITGYQTGAMYYDSDTNNVQSSSNTGHYFRTNGGTTIASILGTGVVDLPYGRIKFPASQNASSDANTLDDYEEGTYTPTLTGSSSGTAGGGSVYGTYTKIGRTVHVRFSFINLNTNLGLTGNWRISLPFAMTLNGSEYMGGFITYNRYVNVSGNWLSLWNSTNGANYVLLYSHYMNGTESVPVSGTVPGNMLLSGEIIYTTA